MNNRCAACKYLRRRCASDCIFSPYFPSNDPQRFVFVHRVYGASNVAKILQQVAVHKRADAADSLCYEAKCRMEDPVYGCAGIVSGLNDQLHDTQNQLAATRAKLALYKSM